MDEAKSAFEELGLELSQEEVEDLFAQFDSDGDGKVTWPEFEEGWDLLQQPEEEEPTDDVATRMQQYASLHPVYGRCAKQADMAAFNAEITKTCGNIHELGTCSWTCTSAMSKWSSKMGCCFETVLDAYKFADPTAEHAWRMWQGTLSGKCGVTFEEHNCGESVGEKGFTDLKKQVGDLENVAATNQQDLEYMANAVTYKPNYWSGDDHYGYGYDGAYYDPSYDTYYPEDSAYGDYYDSTDFSGYQHSYYPEGSMVPPAHYKPRRNGNGVQSMYHAGHGPSNGKRGLGDEVMDFPAWPGEDMGDVHVPSDKLSPYSYAHGKHVTPPGITHRTDRYPERKAPVQQSLAAVQPRLQQLSNAYDDSINYMNTLRIKEAMRGKAPPSDPTAPRFGESWVGSARGAMSSEIAGIAPPTPGESWQGKARQPLQQSLAARGLLPAQLPFEARTDEEKDLSTPASLPEEPEEGEEGAEEEEPQEEEEEEVPRQSEEDGVAFPMARGILIGGDGSEGIGRPAAAAVDRTASPIEGPLYVDANEDGHNHLTPAAAIRQARYDNNWDNAQNEEEKHIFAPLLDSSSMDEAAQPRKDAGTKALEAAGIRV